MPFQPIKFYQAGSFVAGNRLLDPEQRSVQSDADRSNTLTSGHRACQGCGEALGARYALDAAMRATNNRLIAANATGCLEVFSTPYPESSWQLPWMHSLFGNAPAVATGIAAALRVKGRHDVRVVGQAGDGGTVDIGLGCLSGMFERNDDVLFICYDNEAYMNTGVQRSGATPPAARTATTEAVGPEPGNRFGQGKNVPMIAMAHEIPYVATATVADLRDIEYKVERAMSFHGARYLHILVTCPLGWGCDSSRHHPGCAAGNPERTVPRLRGRARRDHGGHQDPPAGAGGGVPEAPEAIRAPLWEVGSTRYRRSPTGAGRPQHRAIRPPRSPACGSALMDKPFAITLNVGSSLANKTGSWRTERAVYVHRLPPCANACPAGENVQQWLYRG